VPAAKVLAALALGAAACGAWAEGRVLRYGQALSAQKSIYSLPVALAEREGLFRREGIDLRVVIPVPAARPCMIHALHDDTVDVTHVATPFWCVRRWPARTRWRSPQSSTIRSTRSWRGRKSRALPT
jgi:ABC-type nitrate/sulfonate/bicarbonate transport system substrate-binding protein